jgi:glycosyltransferase involved in cell wall biosynthesis
MENECMKESLNKKTSVCILRSNPVRPDSRVEKEAWSLVKAGYDVHILAWDRDTNIKESTDFIQVADVKIPITRLGYKATYGEITKNLKAFFSFQFSMKKWLKKHDFDVIHACDFDTAFFSYGVAKRKKERFVFDIFDFIFGEPKGMFQKIVKRAQLRIIDRADATIICTEERKKQIAGSTPKKLTVIHNTPASAQIRSCDKKTEPTERIKIVYVGILQDFRLLKEVAETVSDNRNVELHVGGFGKHEEFFKDMAKRFDNIYFYGCLTYDQTLALENECDIMLAIYDPVIENHRFAAPNKFYESLMLGKPVIMVKNTGMSQVVESNNIGVLIDYSKEGFAFGVNKLIEMKDNWCSIGDKMKELYRNQYCWDEMERRLIQTYAELQNEKDTDC